MPSKSRPEPTDSPSPSDEEDTGDIDIPPAPTTINPYTTLSLAPTATDSEIKSAYRRLALRHHPDKAPAEEKEAAHVKFQEIAFAYAVLSDPRRRSRYDTTGRTEESLEGEDDEGGLNWGEFFKAQYADVVTAERIESFREEYKGSEEERADVLKAYVRGEGRMERVYESVMLSEADEDEERFRGVILEAIEAGEVEGYARFTEEGEKKIKARVAAARKRREKEAEELEEAQREEEENGAEDEDEEEDEDVGAPKRKAARKPATKKSAAKKGGNMDDLAALIQQRQGGRAAQAANFFDSLEAKYAPKGKGEKKRATPSDEPPEEAFAKNRVKKAKN